METVSIIIIGILIIGLLVAYRTGYSNGYEDGTLKHDGDGQPDSPYSDDSDLA